MRQAKTDAALVGVDGVMTGSSYRSRRADAMEEPRKLYRSRSQRMLAGVCGGLAEYFNVDATLIRVLFLILAVGGGTGLVIYVVMWLIVPDVNKA
jgi:phage shock protein C